MSAAIQAKAVELLWRQWTTIGVAGVAPPVDQPVDLESMIALTPFVAAADPRLADEALDWCQAFGRRFVSISRLRQICRLMPDPPDLDHALPRTLLDKTKATERRSSKARMPKLDLPSLIQLKSRYIFGVGARADLLAILATRGSGAGAQKTSAIVPTGYTKQAAVTVLDELAHAGILEKLAMKATASYALVKEGPLRSLLAPIPRTIPRWAERFVIVATVLDAWGKMGHRATYGVELVKALDRIRPTVASAGERAPTVGRPAKAVARIDTWVLSLLEDEVWDDVWYFRDEDVTDEILKSVYDRVVEQVHSGSYPAGYTELETLQFRNIDRHHGTAEFRVQFQAEHPSDGPAFDGHVDGTLTFDPDEKAKAGFLDSVEVADASEHFDLDDID